MSLLKLGFHPQQAAQRQFVALSCTGNADGDRLPSWGFCLHEVHWHARRRRSSETVVIQLWCLIPQIILRLSVVRLQHLLTDQMLSIEDLTASVNDEKNYEWSNVKDLYFFAFYWQPDILQNTVVNILSLHACFYHVYQRKTSEEDGAPVGKI